MPPIYATILYALFFVGVVLLTSAGAEMLRALRGPDVRAVERRLQDPLKARAGDSHRYDVLRLKSGGGLWERYLPFYARFSRLVQGSGTGLTVGRALSGMAAIAGVTFVLLLLVLPGPLRMLSLPLAIALGAALVSFLLMRARAKRIAKFEEQLPDAIDLIVRSLKIGHPLVGAMGVVGRELPAPTGQEFTLAYEEVSYGQDIPTAFSRMRERVPLDDLGYFTMAVQIQQESGGNLVESLSKLSAVIRERFRMFRKVKALTVEGRFSAWFLSLFPFFLVFAVQLVKPDYYTQVMDHPLFPHMVVATFILLIINIVAMRIITHLKV